MRKVILYMASSIDGFVASPDGGVDWIETQVDLGSQEYSFETFLGTIDTIVMGRKSYEQAVSFGAWPWNDHRIIVFSRKGITADTPQTEVITNPNPAFIRELKAEDGKNIWLFGGGNLNHFFLEHDLIDEIMLFVQPTVLGAGIGLFGNKPINPKYFSKLESKALGGGFTLLRYQREESNDPKKS